MLLSILSIALGFIVGSGLQNGLHYEMESVLNHPFYDYFIYLLLSIGLYGSVYGIDLEDAKKHKKTILQVVTLGVILKIAVLALICWVIGLPALVFASIVAQIDPIAIGALLDKNSHRLTKEGSSILRAWSSFDDPMTVLFALYIGLPLLIGQSFKFDEYIFYLLLNLLFAGAAWIAEKALGKKYNIVLLAVCLCISVYLKLTLGIAIIGLFIRPEGKFATQLGMGVNGAFLSSSFLLGFLLVNGVSMLGVSLGMAAFIAQMFATICIFWGKTHSLKDKLYLGAAQYNGITAIILAVFFEKYYSGTVGVVAVAIFVVNILHSTINKIIDAQLKKRVGKMV